MASPNTITFTLLGLLAERPRSAYELAKLIQTSIVRGVWPTAASHSYAQVKQLVSMGYATVATESTGARPRSVYRVTPAGRKALRSWLADDDCKLINFESERLLKFLFAGNSDVDDEAILAGIEQEVAESFSAMFDMVDSLITTREEVVSAARKGALLNLMIDLREAYVAWGQAQQKKRARSLIDEDDTGEYRRAKKRLQQLLEH